MSGEEEQAEAQRRTESRLGLSPVWLVPLAILLIGGWLVYQNLLSHGPTITIEAQTAMGIKAGKTTVKVHNVNVGKVTAVRLSNDYSHAVIEVRMNPGTAKLLAKDSEFWVVKPRVGRRGISGLSTILSGPYVQMQPGSSDTLAYSFELLSRPPVTSADAKGLSIVLASDSQVFVNIGDPIVYMGQTVGRIETAQYQPETDRMRYSAFIKRPFGELITQNTQFWNISGIDFQLSSGGVRVQMGSLETLITGGLTFGVPKGVPAGEPVEKGASFAIYASHKAARQERFDHATKYVVMFGSSVRGLDSGSPVEYKGIRVGTVEKVPYFSQTMNLARLTPEKIPVLISIEPQRLGNAWPDRTSTEWREILQRQFRKGLRASVRPANLITGTMFVDLHYVESGAKYEPSVIGKYPIFPSRKSDLANMTHKINSLLTTLNNLELNKTVNALNHALVSSDQVLNKFETTLTSINKILASEGVQSLPESMHKTLKEIQTVLGAFHKTKPTFENMNQVLRRLNGLLEDLAPLARVLRQSPDALLFGREHQSDPVPKAEQ